MSQTDNRRPIAARNSRFSQTFARRLAANPNITPNRISLAGIAFAAIGAAAMTGAHPAGLVVAAVCIQLRLLCNLFDGMVAVEGGQKTPTGELFNEFPDRVADSLFLVAAGYAAACGWLGWLATLLAALTAYVRVFGGSLGLAQSFRGPMAKQHRMAVLTAACLLGAWEMSVYGSRYVLQSALTLIAVGSLLTCERRARAIAAELKRRAAQSQAEAQAEAQAVPSENAAAPENGGSVEVSGGQPLED